MRGKDEGKNEGTREIDREKNKDRERSFSEKIRGSIIRLAQSSTQCSQSVTFQLLQLTFSCPELV